MASEGDPKIRRVAIVLQSIDADTARKLLAQFPNDVARSIKRAIANLGTVTHAERTAAERELQQLIGMPAAAYRKSATVSPPSPAALVIQQENRFQDAIQLSPEAQRIAETTTHSLSDESSLQAGSQASIKGSQPSHAWLDVPTQVLAGILEQERAIVVAAVLHELPVVMATSVLQHLPMPVATETMAVLPHLHRQDPMILGELLDQVQTRVQEAMRDDLGSHSGLEKLKAIVAHAPTDHRLLWSSALGSVDPKLSAALGLDRSETFVPTQEAEPKKDAASSELPSSAQPVILPFPPSNSAPTRVFATLVDLLRLDDEDFVAVLHSVEPNTVLLALSNADSRVLHRVERLIPKKDIQRLRLRIRQLSDVTLSEIDAACEAILASAESMNTNGTIRSKESMRQSSKPFSAAA
jgi:flagellar motor switch protein FliG